MRNDTAEEQAAKGRTWGAVFRWWMARGYDFELAAYKADAWELRAHHTRIQVLQDSNARLRHALLELLQDTQHLGHDCGDRIERCPVLRARAILGLLQATPTEIAELRS